AALWEGEPLSLPRGVRRHPGCQSLRGRALRRRRPQCVASRKRRADGTARAFNVLCAPAALCLAPDGPPLLLSRLLETLVFGLRLGLQRQPPSPDVLEVARVR